MGDSAKPSKVKIATLTQEIIKRLKNVLIECKAEEKVKGRLRWPEISMMRK